MDCGYHAAGVCRSCTWLGQPYADQLTRKQARVAAALPSTTWLEAVASAESGFRNKAKLVVGGSATEPTLGILGSDGTGVDLRDCGLHEPALVAALPVLSDFISRAAMSPYDVVARRGELKHLIVTASPAGELMVRWVLRSTEPVLRIRKHLPWLLEQLPIAVASVNLQPLPAAVLEGPEETLLHGETLTMRVNNRDLHLRPQSFFQTNTEVAARLYREAAATVTALAPSSVWDLYCGVGGFGVHVAAPRRAVTGVEVSEAAIASAQWTSEELGITATWIAGDAAAFARDQAAPELVIVNPPRRGVGDLADWIEGSGVANVLYSSCNVDSLATDLGAMPSFQLAEARLLDMFPQTEHHEVLALLTR